MKTFILNVARLVLIAVILLKVYQYFGQGGETNDLAYGLLAIASFLLTFTGKVRDRINGKTGDSRKNITKWKQKAGNNSIQIQNNHKGK